MHLGSEDRLLNRHVDGIEVEDLGDARRVLQDCAGPS
jgi:hypothetical protein